MKSAPAQYRNQRLFRPGRQRKQQHLLEVSIRRDRERAIRFRTVSLFLFKTILFLAIVGALWFGGREGFRRYIWQNEYFFLSNTQVRTDGTLTREQIIAAAGVSDQMNFFQLNLGQVREGLEKLPQVERVELERCLPNRLSIEISERQPIAWLTARDTVDPTAADKAFLVDSRGYVMTSRKRRQDFIHLPMISGVVLEDFAPGQKANTLEIQAALELIRLNADSTRWQIQTVDVSKGYCVIVTDRTHGKITFGLDAMDRQLTRLYRLLDYIEPSHREIQTVNLLVERNTPVTFTDEADPAESTPAAVDLSPPKPGAPATAGSDKPGKAKSPAEFLALKAGAAASPAPAKTTEAAGPHEKSPAVPFRRSEADDTKAKDSPPKKNSNGVKKPFRAHG